MTAKEPQSTLLDTRVNVKAKLALFWVALMFFYIYNDILSIFQPGHVAELVKGQLEGVQFTPTLLLAAAVLQAGPSIMILLSLSLKARANRLTNMIVAILYLLVLLGTQFIGEGEPWLYWRLYELMEALFLALIIWTAWRWPTSEIPHQ